MTDLKPCPFCGHENRFDDFIQLVGHPDTPPHKYYIVCPNCGVEPFSTTDDEDGLIKDWNSRPVEDALRAELATVLALYGELMDQEEED